MKSWIALAAMVLGLVCAGGVSAASTAGAAEPEAVTREVSEYRLGSGDKVRITTFGETALTGEFLISGTGKVSLPLVGELPALGLTARELQESVEMSLKQGFLREPRVSVEVLSYRPFYILGEVKSPGTYPFINGLTVVKAVATAGGYTDRANTRRVFIKRPDTEQEEKYDLDSNTPVAPGDTIRIVERFF